MLEDLGNAVKINGVIVPAWNIWFRCPPPGYVPGLVEYFEILFERGTLWVVTVYHNTESIVIEHYDDHNNTQDPDITTLSRMDWGFFLILYKRECEARPEDCGALLDAVPA